MTESKSPTRYFRVAAIAGVIVVIVDVALYLTGPYRGGSSVPLVVLTVLALAFYIGFGLFLSAKLRHRSPD